MNYPSFFDLAPTITVHDGLAELLGAVDDGLITYRYLDAVRLAGHSCPTVAGAYMMTRRALILLYPDQVPQRGEVQVQFASSQDEGVAGVIGSVVGLVTGAAGIGGFKGLGGRFRRQDLMAFGCDVAGEVRFERTDNNQAVTLSAQMNRLEANPQTGRLLRKILSDIATAEERREFAALWQERVKRILIDHADDAELIVVT